MPILKTDPGLDASVAGSHAVRRSLGWKGGLAVLAVLSALSLIVMPLAQAAVYTYANNIVTAENQVRYSGTRPSIAGGTARVEPWSADGAGTQLKIESYWPAPGYQKIMSAVGGTSVNMNHYPASTNASQKCYWNWPFAPGQSGALLHVTCATK